MGADIKCKVIAVVVTYNRKELLMECVEAVLGQTYKVEKLILIDNCSTDGTKEELENRGYLLNPQIMYVKTDANIGGAGGFYEGMVKAKEYSYDWIWLMDDDTIPTQNCLEALIEADRVVENTAPPAGLEHAVRPSFFASAVYGAQGEFMNLPKVSSKRAPNGYLYWYKFLDQGLVNIAMATFVSILIKKEAIEKCGLPCKDFFIWGDDSEYTTRLTKYYGDAYFVGKSKAIHKRANAQLISINREMNPQRIEMFHYRYRNAIIINQYYEPGYHMLFHAVLSMLGSIRYIGKKLGGRKAKAIIKGSWESIIQYRKFKAYIDSQIKKGD